ncbi:MAG: winged helix-turn-helix domain-containing protein [Candidatus Hodarchaeales archaeon]
MRTMELAKIIELIAHPIRLEILKTLNYSSQSYSQLLKSLSLNSTSKFSFHLDKLNLLVEKGDSGKYGLTDAGVNLIQLIDSHEKQDLQVNDVANDDNRKHEANHDEQKQNSVGLWQSFINHPNFLMIYYTLSVFSYLLFIIIHYFWNLIPGSKQWNPIFEAFPLFTALAFLVMPVGFFISYAAHLNGKNLSEFILGSISYIILTFTTLVLISALNSLFLNIIQPYWWAPENMPTTLLDAIIEFVNLVLFNKFTEDMLYENFYLLHHFWLIVYAFLTVGLVLISKHKKWIKWKMEDTTETYIFPTKFGFLENSYLWSFMFLFGFVVFPLLLPMFIENSIFNPRFFSQILPITSVLILNLIVLLSYMQKINSVFLRNLLLLMILLLEPCILFLNSITDSHFPFLNLLLGMYQVIILFCYLILLLKLMRYWNLSHPKELVDKRST